MGKRGHYVNPCLVLLNLVFVVASIAFIGVGIWLAQQNTTSCVHFLQAFLIGAGFFMLLVALAGLIGSWCRVMWLLYLNFGVMFVLLLVILGTTVFVLVVTSHGIKASVAENDGRDQNSNWLVQQVNNKVKKCTRNGQICRLVQETYTQSSYNKVGWSALQVGCCEPPVGCNNVYTNNNNMTSDELLLLSDCQAWSEATNGFCSQCRSCKAAVAENIRHLWHEIAIFKIITLLLLIPTYFLSCCYFKQDEPSLEHPTRPCQECLSCFYSCLP